MVHLLKLILPLAVLLYSSYSIAQAPNWQCGETANSGSAEQALDITTDLTTGQTYICDWFDGDISGEYTTGTKRTPDMSSLLNEDGFTAKYDLFGSTTCFSHPVRDWAHTATSGSTGVDEVEDPFKPSEF